jgi:DNA-binding helix-hairpin-helix protein with protein kinase domain
MKDTLPVAHFQVVPLLQQRFSSGHNTPPKEAFAAAMQSWRQRYEKCVRLQGDYVEK